MTFFKYNIPGLTAYFDNSAIYFKTFLQPCAVQTQTIKICFYDHCNDKIFFVNSDEIIYAHKFPKTGHVVWIQRNKLFQILGKNKLSTEKLKAQEIW